MSVRVAVIGLGGIGAGAARGVIAKGLELVAYDIRPEAIEAIEGARAATSPRAAAEAADFVLIAVWNDEQVRAVLTGPDGVLEASEPPRVVVVLSTTTLETIRWADAELGERGIGFIDCGVAGGVKALAEASIVAMAGGTVAAMDAARPVLEAFADPVIHLGPSGAGMAAKLARNMITYTERVVVWEATRLAVAAEVDPEAFLEVVRATDKWNFHTALTDRGFLPGVEPPDPRFAEQTASYAHKDLLAALELGRQVQAPLPVTELADQLYPEAVGRE
jgi:3-hydroxyisobutyrate dehydrogenase-like beta-hydroxyacid dehydrogenase